MAFLTLVGTCPKLLFLHKLSFHHFLLGVSFLYVCGSFHFWADTVVINILIKALHH